MKPAGTLEVSPFGVMLLTASVVVHVMGHEANAIILALWAIAFPLNIHLARKE